MLTPTRAAVIPMGSQANWVRRLTVEAAEALGVCVTRLAWRPSVHGGRAWAKPAALERDVRDARTREAGASAADSLTQGLVTVTLLGPQGPDPAGLLRGLMQSLAVRLAVDLRVGGAQRPLAPHEWRAGERGDGDWNGTVYVQFPGRASAHEAATAKNGPAA